MKRLTAVILIALFVLLGCSRVSFEKGSFALYPTVVISTNQANEIATASGGLALTLYSESLDLDSEYQINLISPSNIYSWDIATKPTLISDLKVLFVKDLLYPADIAIEEGNYIGHLLLKDGQKFDYIFKLELPNRYKELLTEAALLDLESENNESWTINYLDQNGEVLSSKESAIWKIAQKFDEQSKILLVVRSLL